MPALTLRAGLWEQGDRVFVDGICELAVDLLDHPGRGVAEEAGDDEGVDALLLQPRGVGAAEVVRGAGLDVGTSAGGGEVSAHAGPALDDGATAGGVLFEDFAEGLGDRYPAAGAGGLGPGEEEPSGLEVDVLVPGEAFDLGGAGAGVDGDEYPELALVGELVEQGGELGGREPAVAWAVAIAEAGDEGRRVGVELAAVVAETEGSAEGDQLLVDGAGVGAFA